jgi:hypothetical protein
MSYDIKQDTITVNSIKYDVEREPDRASPEETLTIRDFSVEEDDYIYPFPGLTASLGYEQYIESHMSPREWSNVGTMAVSYRGYDLGDENISEEDFEVECTHCNGHGQLAHLNDRECGICAGTGMVTLNPIDYYKQNEGARVVLPLIVYEHSGITMRVGKVGDYPFDSQGWDTSFVGFIYDTPEGVKQCIGKDATDEEIKAALVSEVKAYASYLEGDVTYYYVEDDETGFNEGCGGFVGDSKQCESECFAALEHAIEKRLAEEAERTYWLSRDVQTV